MYFKQNQIVLKLYEKSIIIKKNGTNNKNIARFYDYRGIEITKPLEFENTQKGFQYLLLWLKKIITDIPNQDINHKSHKLIENYNVQRKRKMVLGYITDQS